MTITLAPATSHYNSQAEDIADLYATMLRQAGWTTSVTMTHHEGQYDPDGVMWAKEQVHVVLTATRKGSGHLVVGWRSDLKVPEGRECVTKRGTAYRHVGDLREDARELTTYREFTAAIESMTR
jgi:hypothetical protein